MSCNWKPAVAAAMGTFGCLSGMMQTAAAATWPSENAWMDLATDGALAVVDDADDTDPAYPASVPGGLDCVGDEDGSASGGPRTALWWSVTESTLYFRIRVDANPTTANGTWAVYLDYDGDSVSWDVAVKATRFSDGSDASASGVYLVGNAADEGIAPYWMDPHTPDEVTSLGSFDDVIRISEVPASGAAFNGDADYFLDIQLERSTLPALSISRYFRMAAATGGANDLANLTVDLDLCGGPQDDASGGDTDLEDVWTDLVAIDGDRDGLDFVQEALLGTDPEVADTDEDGLSDGDEVDEYGTSPTTADTDNDGLLDGDEGAYDADPLNSDTDGDGLQDGQEVEYRTDPTRVDTDGDGLTDTEEYDCNPSPDRDPGDLDGDGLPDEDERSGDTDRDGLPDYCDDDDDDDGLPTAEEGPCGTAHDNPDTDGDGILDGDESCGEDSDGDGIPDVVDATGDPNGAGGPIEAPGDLNGLTNGRLAGGSCSNAGVSSAGWWPLALAVLAVAWRRRFGLGVVATGTAIASPAAAQDLNAQTLTPAIGEDDFVRTLDSKVQNRGFGSALLFHHAKAPLVYLRDDGSELPIVDSLGTLDVQAWGSLGKAQFGLQMPFHPYATGFGLPGGTGHLGDLTIDARLQAIDRSVKPVGIGADVGLVLPTGDGDAWLGDPSLAVFARAVASAEVGSVLLSSDLGIEARRPEILPDDTTWGSRLPFAAGARFDVLERIDIVTELIGEVFLGANNPGNGTSLEGLLSTNLTPADGWTLTAGAAKGLSSGLGTPEFRLLAGVKAHIPAGSRSQPATAVPAAVPNRVMTRIQVLSETTGDGVGGAVIEFKDGPDGVGRVTVPPVDGVEVPLRRQISYYVHITAPGYQDLQYAIEVPSNAAGTWNQTFRLQPVGRACTVTFLVQDLDGRPVAAEVRSVSGGLPPVQTDPSTGVGALSLTQGDAHEVVVGAKGFSPEYRAVSCRADQSGALVDSSREVILRPPRARLTGNRISIDDTIQFETDSDIIDARSKGILDDVARVLQEHPELALVEVRGHTDSRGTDVHNLTLSGRRAQAVVRYLQAAGVAESRLRPIGLGESVPIQSGESDAAHEVNRRVEFLVVTVSPAAD